MRLRAPIADDIFLHSSMTCLDHESRPSIIKPNDLVLIGFLRETFDKY